MTDRVLGSLEDCSTNIQTTVPATECNGATMAADRGNCFGLLTMEANAQKIERLATGRQLPHRQGAGCAGRPIAARLPDSQSAQNADRTECGRGRASRT
jgi:hypothetical protein